MPGCRRSMFAAYLIILALVSSLHDAPTSLASRSSDAGIAPSSFIATPELAVATDSTASQNSPTPQNPTTPHDPTTTSPNVTSQHPDQRTFAAQNSPAAVSSQPNSATVAPKNTSSTPKKTSAPPASFSVGAGGSLPSGSMCASRVTKMRERVASNTKANKTKPSGKLNFNGNFGSSKTANAYLGRIDGNYTGTTDEIIQWASCKWGIDPDIVRAQAFVESTWRQSAQGGVTDRQDLCVAGMKAPCPRAFGILQLRADYQKNTYPNSATSTAFNLDYSLAYWRAVYDGVSWLGVAPKGDLWGSIGAFYSGKYNDDPGKAYVAETKKQLSAKPWLSW